VVMDELKCIAERVGSVEHPLALLEGLFACAPLACLVYRADGRCLMANQAFRDLFGREPEPEYSILTDEVAANLGYRDPVLRALSGETAHMPAHWYVAPAARRIGIELTAFPLFDPARVVRHVAVFCKDVTAELLLQAERDLEDAVRQHSVEIVTVRRADEAVARISPSVTRILGYPPERFAHILNDTLHPDDAARALALHEAVLRDPGQVCQAEYRARHADGSWRWMSTTLINMRHHPTIQGIISYSHDVTDLKLANEALRRSEEEIAATLRSIGDAVIATDIEGRVVRMNPVAEQLTGWMLAEALGKNLEEVFRIVDEETRLPVESPAVHVLREGGVVGLASHSVLIARDGSEHIIADRGAPIHVGEEHVQGVVFVFRDVSEEMRAELQRLRHQEELRRSEEALRAALHASHSVAWTLDFATAKISLSDNTPDVIGASPEQSLEQLTVMVHPDDRTAVFESTFALSEGRIPSAQRYRFFRGDTGELVYLESRARPIRDCQGRVTGATGQLVDVTDRSRAEELRARGSLLELQNRRIQEANRLKSQFLANMSHELRTPLNAIIGFAELLHDGVVEPGAPEHKEFLGDILASSRHLLGLINDVLDLTKIEAGKLEFFPEPVSLASIIEEVCNILRAIAAAKSICVEVDPSPSLTDISIDAARLKQILYNYLSNALKFTPAGGRVTVRTRPEGPATFRIEVEDTGIGIAPGNIGRLFVEFQQLEDATTKRHAGTGLGLALTRSLVEAQGGSVGVRSVPGQGSVFHAVLPRKGMIPSVAEADGIPRDGARRERA
jgi:PAS domain S-box-containing protein